MAWLYEQQHAIDATSARWCSYQQYAIDAHLYGNQPPRHRADALTKTFHAGLDADADQFVCDERRVRPLHLAAECGDRRRSLRTCIALLESGCDAQCADYEGRTCLHVVAERGPRGLVELLMDAGCSKEAEDVHGRKPADAAEAAGQLAMGVRNEIDPEVRADMHLKYKPRVSAAQPD